MKAWRYRPKPSFSNKISQAHQRHMGMLTIFANHHSECEEREESWIPVVNGESLPKFCFISQAQVTVCCICYVFWLLESFLKHFNISFFTLLILHELEYVLISLNFPQFLIGSLYRSKLTTVFCGTLNQLTERKTFLIDSILSRQVNKIIIGVQNEE